MSYSIYFEKFDPLLSFLSSWKEEDKSNFKLLILVNNYHEYTYLEAKLQWFGFTFINSFVSWSYTPNCAEIKKYDIIIEYPGWHLLRSGPEDHLNCMEEFTRDYYPFELL